MDTTKIYIIIYLSSPFQKSVINDVLMFKTEYSFLLYLNLIISNQNIIIIITLEKRFRVKRNII